MGRPREVLSPDRLLVDASRERLRDPLYRCFVMIGGLVAHGEVPLADAVACVVRRGGELGRSRGEVDGFVAELSGLRTAR